MELDDEDTTAPALLLACAPVMVTLAIPVEVVLPAPVVHEDPTSETLAAPDSVVAPALLVVCDPDRVALDVPDSFVIPATTVLDAPPIQRLTGMQAMRIKRPSVDLGGSGELADPATQRPRQRCCRPTMLGTDRPSVSSAAGTLQGRKVIQYSRGAVKIVHTF